MPHFCKIVIGFAVVLLSFQMTVLADISLEAGTGRDKGGLALITLFNRESNDEEWLNTSFHYGYIQRNSKAHEIAGLDVVIGHTFLNPYIIVYMGVTHFGSLTTRVGTPWNFHVGLEIGHQGPTFDFFLKFQHWSNGPAVTSAPGPNPGEEYGTLGFLARF